MQPNVDRIGVMTWRVATYRIQLTPTFGFAEAESIVPDLARFGVSHLYLSPVAEAVSGSTHGYDVVDPTAVRAELGGRDGLWALAETARGHGMSLLIDIVPNHISSAATPRNHWWWELLRDGPDATSADYFDVDWEAGNGQLLLPFLGGSLDDAIRLDELHIRADRGALEYHDQAFPLRGAGTQSDLEELLATQHYRLTPFDSPERNVRRFFAVDQLVGIRPEIPAVAEAVHRTILDLAADRLLDGVRLDHIDGLADPTAYLHGLRVALGDQGWIIVEKIVVGDEELPPVWSIGGTTGYEWITLVDHLFTHPAGEAPLTDLWQQVSGDTMPYHDHETAGIRGALTTLLRPELERLARCASAEAAAHGHDLAADELLDPLIEITVQLGRYRTYLGSRDETDEGSDRALVQRSAANAANSLDDRHAEVTAPLVELLTAGRETTRRWQQLTGPALAKGGEDQALYRSLRLTAHNEVGGDPGRWTTTVDTFHHYNERTARDHPETLLAGSTHDTKRSEDVRARLLALAEIPERWSAAFEGWQTVLADHGLTPNGWTTTLAVQSAVGAWPIDEQRLGDYLVKAAREAALDTTWAARDHDFESGLRSLARALTSEPLATSISKFVDSIEPIGHAIALAQLAIRLTAPGVPDLYQRSESWLHTLVDPDNRRLLDPSDLKATVDVALAAGDAWSSPAPKAALITRLLQLRQRHPASFGATGSYESIRVRGRHSDHVICFLRGSDTAADVAVVAARFPASRPDGWGNTIVDLPAGTWRDVLSGRVATGGAVAVSALLGNGADARPAGVLELQVD